MTYYRFEHKQKMEVMGRVDGKFEKNTREGYTQICTHHRFVWIQSPKSRDGLFFFFNLSNGQCLLST